MYFYSFGNFYFKWESPWHFALYVFREWGTFFKKEENDHLKWVYWRKIFALKDWFALLLLLLPGLSTHWAHLHLVNFYRGKEFAFDHCRVGAHSEDSLDRCCHSQSGCPLSVLLIRSLFSCSFYITLLFILF